jgi:calcineurin-like phosphoesterase family protein
MAQHRGFHDEFYHDEKLMESWNSVVHKKDLTYILGDVTMENSDYYFQLDRLNGRKIVVMGNHDLHQHTRQLLNHVESVAGMIDYKGFCLTHCPIHPNELPRYRGNIHAHIHENQLIEVMAESSWKDEGSVLVPTLHKYFCVDARLVNYRPKTIEELLNERSKQ